MDTDLLRLFEDSLERFNRERYSPAQLVARSREPAGTGLLAEMAQMGWFELLRGDCDDEPAASSVVRLLPLFRAAGEGAWREPLAGALGAAAVVAGRADVPTRRASLVDGLISAHALLAYAAREADDGWRRVDITTVARREADGHVLDGHKVAVMDVESCAGIIVLAVDVRTERPGYFLVARDAAGLVRTDASSIDGRCLSDLKLTGVRAEYLCAGDHAPRAEGWDAILGAAEAVGIMRGANRDTAAYLRERRQFGRSLIDFQVLQHRLVEMHLLERETDALLQSTAEAYDVDAPGLARRLLVLRAQASRALRQVTREAVQMHGGMGVTQETRVSHYYRRALMLDSLYGSEEAALEQLAAA
jgi:alkylation response protein AidB-like acyl-CoA dehydrogenase